MAKMRPPSSRPSQESQTGAEVIYLRWPDVLSPEQIERMILAPIIEELESPVRGAKPRLVEPLPASTSAEPDHGSETTDPEEE